MNDAIDVPTRKLMINLGVADGITGDATVDGGWSRFGACSKACGGGTQSRNCSDPVPANGGKKCTGDATNACNTQACAGTACWRTCTAECFVFVVAFCFYDTPRHVELIYLFCNKGRVNNDLSVVSQMALQATVHLTADGLGSARALQLVVAGLTVELAAILRLRMAGRIV